MCCQLGARAGRWLNGFLSTCHPSSARRACFLCAIFTDSILVGADLVVGASRNYLPVATAESEGRNLLQPRDRLSAGVTGRLCLGLSQRA